MNSTWFSLVTLIAALVIGYGVIVSRDDETLSADQDQAVLLGYYLKNAIITETTADGAPQMRFAANEVKQNLDDDTITLSAVRIDYARGGANATPERWVLNADRATAPSQPEHATQQVQLRGNVTAHSVNAKHAASLATPSLDIDLEREIARTSATVLIDIDGHHAEGRDLIVDMKKDRIQVQRSGVIRMAAQTPANTLQPAGDSSATKTRSLLPELFLYETLEYQDNVLVLTKVRSASPPLVSADQARATGADTANNQWTLTGNLRIELPDQGKVTADAATLTVRNNQMVRAIVTGSPVHLEHPSKDGADTVFGRADNIDYDVPAQTVLFTGNASFTRGEYDFGSESIHYNLTTRAVRAARGSIGLGPRQNTPDAAQ